VRLETYYRILKHDPEGTLVKDSGPIPSGSYVIQFLEAMKALLDGVTTNATDVDGAETQMYWDELAMNNQLMVNAGAGEDKFGIVVGTNAGASAEDNEDYALATKILHDGAGAAGKMNYQATLFTAPAVDNSNVDFDIARAFLNETGSTITVKEIGIQTYKWDTPYKNHLLLRDVVTDEDVLAAETLTVVYTLRTTA